MYVVDSACSSIESNFQNFASQNGFTISSPRLDGNIHRFNTQQHKNSKSGWYWGTMQPDGAYYAVIGDWANGGTKIEFKSVLKKPVDKKLMAQMSGLVEVGKKQFNTEKLEEADQAKAKAVRMLKFGQKSLVEQSLYWQKKGLKGLNSFNLLGVLDQAGVILYVPMIDPKTGDVSGLQEIYEDSTKLFLKGQRTKGLGFRCSMPVPPGGTGGTGGGEDIVYICEGVATAVTVANVTGKTTWAALGSGNLKQLAEAVKTTLKDGIQVVICADKDTAGLTAAQASGFDWVAPKFQSTEDSEKFSDFNDLLVREGKEAVLGCVTKKMVVSVRDKKDEDMELELEDFTAHFKFMGFCGDKHYFYPLKTKNILANSKLDYSFLLNLAPNEFWLRRYSGRSEEGKPVRIDLSKLRNDLIQKSQATGMFIPSRIRGAGVWVDKDSIVYNTGESIYKDGQSVDFESVKSRYFYIKTVNQLPNIHKKPLTAVEAEILLTALDQFNWKYKRSTWFILGWISIARIAGALPVRPHGWITGESSAGKSTLMDLVNLALGENNAYKSYIGATTEAGIRQDLKSDSLPLIFDEFETTDKNKNKERIQSIIDLFRQSWCESSGNLVKGSASGDVSQFSLRFAGLVSSIRVSLFDEADLSRFVELEILKHSDDAETWSRKKIALNAINKEYGERLFSRMLGSIPRLMVNYNLIYDAFRASHTARMGQQYGMLLAGAYTLMYDDCLDVERAHNLIKELDFDETVKSVNGDSNAEECLIHLLTWIITVEDRGLVTDYKSTTKQSIGNVIVEGNPYKLEQLRQYGIRVDGDQVMIANKHAELTKIYSSTKWSGAWSKSLQRIEGAAVSKKSIRIEKDKPSNPTIILVELIKKYTF